MSCKRNATVVAFAVAVSVWGAFPACCWATNAYSRVFCDASALPAAKRFVADLFGSRIKARIPPSNVARTLTVRFVIDAAIPGEKADVKVKDGQATVAAGRFRGLVQGAGVLLRRVRYGCDTFTLADGTYAFAPKKEVRMAYFARHFHNWYHHATAEELREYIDDLALAGHNAFHFQYAYPTFNRADADEAELRRFLGVSKMAYDRIRELDCGFRVIGGSNQAPKDSPEELRGVPNSDPKRGNAGFNVCPAKPGAMDFLIEYRKRMLEEMAGVKADYIQYWPFDEGGCDCEKCRPWGGNGFLKLIERYAPINKAAFPGAKTIISTWTFHDDDWAGLYRWLETHDIADYLLVDTHTDFPKYPLEHPVPKNIPIVTFPEISMWGRDFWGSYGAIAMPKRFFRLFHQANRVSNGFVSYSEGRYEDINKEVVCGLYINPDASVDDLLRSYAAFYLPGTDPEDFVRLCGLLEANHVFPGNHYRPDFSDVPEDSDELAAYRRRAEEACHIADRMQTMISPAFRDSWRWRLVFLRTVIDREILATREARPKSAKAYFDELRQIDRGPDWCWSDDVLFLVATDGVPKADIVIPENPKDAVRYAAEELKHHLDKAFDASFKIVTEDAIGESGMTYHFFLGDTKAAASAGIPSRELKMDERCLRHKGCGLYLIGRDTNTGRADITNVQTVKSLGTLYAVYDFLETELGVMWIWPGETGEVIPNRSSLAVSTLDRGGVEPLDQRYFYVTYGGERGKKIGFSNLQAFNRFFEAQSKFVLRHRHGRRINTMSGHSFENWWERFGKDHPEYFNLLPYGERRPFHLPLNVTMCCAEPGVWRQKAADWIAWWRETGKKGGYEPWVNCCENDSAGLCTCEKCRAWDPPDPRFRQHPYWNGSLTREFLDSLWKEPGPNHGDWALSWMVGDNRWDIPEHDANLKPVAPLSDRYANFYNHIQAEIVQYEPKARVIGYAYENYVEAPQKTMIDPRVIIEYVPRSYLPYDKTESEFFRKHWMGWKNAGVRDFLYRPNYMLACGGYHLDQGPLILADFAFAYTNGMRGCTFDSLRGSWSAHALMEYALIRAFRDPLHGYDKARDEMLSAFGGARKEVAEFLDGVCAHSASWTFADIRRISWANHAGKQGGGSFRNCAAILAEYFNDSFFSNGYSTLDRATKAACGDAKVLARIDFLRKGLRNTELTRAVRIAQKEWKKSGDEAKKKSFEAAFKAMNDYRASVEDDFVCNFAFTALNERNGMQWPHKELVGW